MKCTWRRIVSLLLVAALCLGGMIPAVWAADEIEDGAAFGSMMAAMDDATVTAAWTNDAVSETEMKTLLNSQELHPQRTGWKELDDLLGQMLQSAGSDTYSQLRYMYDWLVKNVTYSWEGYSYTVASVASYNSFSWNYLKDMTYEDGLQKSIPDDMANRTYHILTAKRGVCYDYAIAIAVIARYIGIDSYVHTGRFVFEDTSLGAGHHGWAVLTLGGASYVFDPQRDARNWQYYGQLGYYFGIPSSKTYRYQPSYWAADAEANPARDAQMLSVTAARAHKVQVTANASGGTVSGQGSYITGTQATLTATPDTGLSFSGWYDAEGQLLSTSPSYTFTVTDTTVLTAKFAVQVDVIASRSGTVNGAGACVLDTPATLTAVPAEGKSFAGWYDAYGNLLSTEGNYTFTASKNQTLYALFEGDVFCDVGASHWYLEYAMESAEKGLVKGITAVTFGGEIPLTRAMAVTILARMDGADTTQAPVSTFSDVPKESYCYDAINWAAANGIVEGRSAESFDPHSEISRQDFITIVVRYLEWKGYALEAQELTYTDNDQIAPYAWPMLEKAQKLELVNGYPEGDFRPQGTLLRRDGVKILVLLDRYLEANPVADTITEPAG